MPESNKSRVADESHREAVDEAQRAVNEARRQAAQSAAAGARLWSDRTANVVQLWNELAWTTSQAWFDSVIGMWNPYVRVGLATLDLWQGAITAARDMLEFQQQAGADQARLTTEAWRTSTVSRATAAPRE